MHFQGIQMYDFMSTTLNLPYRINLSNLTEIRHTNGAIKRIRRVQQAPYPLIKVNPDVELFGVLDTVERSTNINVPAIVASLKQLPPISAPSKSKKLFPNLVKSKHQTSAPNDANTLNSASNNTNSSSSGSSSSKLARQIFSNLNIFSNKQHSHNDQSQNSPNLTQSKQQQSNTNIMKQEPVSSLRRTIEIGHQNHHRRLSSKSNSSTASTQNLITSRHSRRSYRSQDDDVYLETDGDSSCYSANASLAGGNLNAYGIRRPSVDTISTYLSHESNERLHYAATDSFNGDDDVFLPSHKINGSIVGVDADSDMISRFVNVVHPEWPNCRPCVICLEELQHNPNNPAVSLIRCEHLMHLNCLNHLIITQSEQHQKQSPESNRRNTPLYIECPVCGIVYGEKYGNQPAGTMTWSIIAKQVAGHEGQNTIQIVYKYVLDLNMSFLSISKPF